MTDLIQLLPDSIANQIAAGEVVQRPASAVKELLENAVDAGAANIRLVLKEAGKSLIQVTDDGCGMSPTDARMCFERHATSKIRTANDLFALHTFGFRGEALASIAAIAQVELRTRRQGDEMGVRIVIEGFELKTQEACQTPVGTNFQIKNLFYNVPARRNFLKSDPVELRHALNEFERVALSNPEIFFSVHHNGQEIYHLPAGNLRQRIVSIYGKDNNSKLVPVSEETDVLRITGFVGKPEMAKKTRGEQLFFVNGRFIKSSYLHHAVQMAFEQLIAKDAYPFYVLFLDIDPARIDINVHPTKQEIKFDDERLVYNYLRVAVRHALGQNAVAPSLDFEADPIFGLNGAQRNQTTPNDNDENTHASNGNTIEHWLNTQQQQRQNANREQNPNERRQENNLREWQTLYEGLRYTISDEPATDDAIETTETTTITLQSRWEERAESDFDINSTEPTVVEPSLNTAVREPYQIHATYIVSHIKSGFILIDQQAAHERILYERYLAQIRTPNATASQRQLFPKNIQLSAANAAILRELLPTVNALGFDVQAFGGDSFVLHGIPADWQGKNEQAALEQLLEQYQQDLELRLDAAERLARTMARNTATKRGTPLNVAQMEALIDQLFACAMPFKSPNGRNCFITYELEALAKQFLAS